MSKGWMKSIWRWDTVTLAVLIVYPIACAIAGNAFADQLGSKFGYWFGDQLSTLFIFALLALALNVAVGYSGLLQLGIAAFFAIGVNITGILTTRCLSVPNRIYGGTDLLDSRGRAVRAGFQGAFVAIARRLSGGSSRWGSARSCGRC